MDIDKYGANRR